MAHGFPILNESQYGVFVSICNNVEISGYIWPLTYWGWDNMAAIFQTIFSNAFSIKILLKFVLKGPINNIPALIQIMAWRRPGDKPLSEPMMV